MHSQSHSEPKLASDVEKILGLRPLVDQSMDTVLQHNSWDNATWGTGDKRGVLDIISRQRDNCMSVDQAAYLLQRKHVQWDQFYTRHKNKFFKDRRWLCHEVIPTIEELKYRSDIMNNNYIRILEVGCGVGNSIYPLLSNMPDTHFSAFDFSAAAISVLRSDVRHDPNRVHSFVFDATSSDPNFDTHHTSALTDHVPEGSIDIALMMFVLSAIEPKHHSQVLSNIMPVLKTGGVVIFRDYALYDQSQLQFKDGRCILDRLYARGDGTLVHYFDEEYIARMCNAVPGLLVEENKTINSILVNRKKVVKMVRCWSQGKFCKI